MQSSAGWHTAGKTQRDCFKKQICFFKSSMVIKPTQTRIYWKKYVNGSLNSEGHLKNLKPGTTLIQAYIYLFMSSKPNPARESVPLN